MSAQIIASRVERRRGSELDRIEGELKQLQGASTTEIETCFGRAIAITRTQGAKSLELRATRDLARLWHDQGGTVMPTRYSRPPSAG